MRQKPSANETSFRRSCLFIPSALVARRAGRQAAHGQFKVCCKRCMQRPAPPPSTAYSGSCWVRRLCLCLYRRLYRPPLPYSPSRTPEHPPLLRPRRRAFQPSQTLQWPGSLARHGANARSDAVRSPRPLRVRPRVVLPLMRRHARWPADSKMRRAQPPKARAATWVG